MRFAILLAAALIASPVAAQLSVAKGGYGPYVAREARAPESWGRDLGDMRDRIEDGRDSGQLSRGETRRLRRGANGIGAMADRYAAGGLSDAEQRELDMRTTALRDQVNARRLGVGTQQGRK